MSLGLPSCGNDHNDGETLAKRYCATCHGFVDPGLLDKKIWDASVLPEMKFRMGLDFSKLQFVNEVELNEILRTLPDAPLVSEEEWNLIRDYYLSVAPDTLMASNKITPSPLHQFAVSTLNLPITGKTLLTMTKYDAASGSLFISTRRSNLYRLTSKLTLADSFQLESPASDIVFGPSARHLVSCMGIMDPNDQAAGSVVQLAAGQEKPATLIDSLKRPVDLQKADLNNDGQEDLVVSAFGNFTGGLYVQEKKEDRYVPHLIHAFPGTRKTIIQDLNNDGLPDILALMSQGDEQISLFTNRGNFRFAYRVLLKFPPVYGSSYFDLVDLNSDGHRDILYTNGDNADFSTILKPYHGIRIFLNDGKNHFEESWFYPMYGASMARAVDFDEDGDPDIAAISFFPDFEKAPQGGFVYLQNNGGKFTPFETPLAASSRWITMETADIDDDRDVDIVLAALAFPTAVPDSLYQRWEKSGTSLLVLRNKLRP
ncbi:MAG: VCBS repeat-containing protein [Chryseosolibacter sp.]